MHIHNKHPQLLGEHQGPLRGDDHGRAPPLRDAQAGQAQGAGHQRQRLGDQVEVRQPLRLPRVAGRRHQARHRHDDRRQDRWSSPATATSARAAPTPCAASARACSSPRSTPSARFRRRWKASRSRRWRSRADRRHLRHRHRLLRHHPRRAHAGDEGRRASSATSATSTWRSTWPG